MFRLASTPSKFVLLTAILQSSLPRTLVSAHRSLPSGVTCGSQFATPDDALTIPNTKISWASYRIFDCNDPVFWLEAEADAGQKLKFTVTVPVIDRFEDARLSVAFLHPSLDAPQDTTGIPDGINDFIVQENYGISVFDSPDDQSTCDHLQDFMMLASTVKDDRCHFYEPFGGSNSWVVMDQEFEAVEAGLYKIAVYNAAGTPAKAAFACCDWPEDFITAYDYPTADCPYCGTNDLENPAWSSHFYEQKSMTPYAGFPPAVSCAAPDSKDLEPSDEQCPPLPASGDPAPQPSSCNLGCSSDGECHSHNVFGECTHMLDWNIQPKFGDANVHKVIIFKGDAIHFSYQADGQLAHNLFDMKDETALEQCNFDEATNLADVEEIVIGHTVGFNEVGTYHFACSIGCMEMEFPSSQNLVAGGDTNGTDPVLCHCELGQKLTVEVKDATEGMRCHDHAQVSLTTDEEATEAVSCGTGEVNARAIGNQDYGAEHDYQCAEFCTPPMGLNFMTGVEEGSCIDEGYAGSPTDKTVQPPGSPNSVDVRITSMTSVSTSIDCSDGQVAARAVGNAAYGATDDSKCAEFCTTTMALSFMPSGVEEGSCVDVGYTLHPIKLEVQPPGSPQAVVVRITSNEDEDSSTCHCHSYEEIACPEVEEESDTLYVEHIAEIEAYCTGILDGTDAVCPYKCFQPMEVLHLHYLECTDRVVDATYLAVNATDMCHIAAVAPDGTDCPVVTLGRSNEDGDDETLDGNDDTSGGAPSRMFSSVGWSAVAARILFAVMAVFVAL